MVRILGFDPKGIRSIRVSAATQKQMQNGCLALGEWLKAIRQIPFV